ncbi:deoxyribonuclease IV [Kribbella jiaozuonensis]|uniref:Deoxyribonuclease IV n=1 Tax=Kribbella jiaozuonensis TaxID=2575441 RepID=A0A4U3LVP8_9ACTN|nr:deoxyribonuclease IV [Kribbella jiaozuonensis]TKK80195.1 deoxyribonuclease IV [Kribbella jiaozuonensis]
MRVRIGSHVAVAGGLVKVGLAEATEVGAEIIQLFAGNPRSWVPAAVDPAADEAFRTACAERDLPVVVHAPHLINLCSPSDAVLTRSTAALELTMQRATSLGATTVVVHAGSLVAKGRRAEVLRGLHDLVVPIAHRWPDVRLLIEPTAGAGEAAASTIESSIEYLDALNDPEIGLCLDTCHLHAAGEDLRAIVQVADRVGLVHVNDSRDPAGSRRDRHESLGRGMVGRAELEDVLASLHGIPMLVETPTHARDVGLLKDLRDRLGVAVP